MHDEPHTRTCRTLGAYEGTEWVQERSLCTSALPAGRTRSGSRSSIRKDVAAKNFLKYYATKLNGVEVNYTFRRLCRRRQRNPGWRMYSPEFRFVPKANHYITHMRRLKNVAEPLERFLPRWSRCVSASSLVPCYSNFRPISKRCSVAERFSRAAAARHEIRFRVPARVVV